MQINDNSILFQIRISPSFNGQQLDCAELLIESERVQYSLLILPSNPGNYYLYKLSFKSATPTITITGQIDIIVTFLQSIQSDLSSSFMYSAVMQSSTNIYYVGGTKFIGSSLFGTLGSYSRLVAFVSTFDPKQSCVTANNVISERLIYTYNAAQNALDSLTTLTLSSYTYEFQKVSTNPSLTNVDLSSCILTPALCLAENQASISPVVVPDQDHIIEKASSFKFPLTVFEGSLQCDDGAPTITATLSDGSPLPSFFIYNTALPGFQSVSVPVEGVYIVKVTGTISASKYATNNIKLNVIRCANSVITLATSEVFPKTFDITLGIPVLIPFPNAVSSIPQCTFTFVADDGLNFGQSLNPTIVTVDQTQRIVRVFTKDQLKQGRHSVRMRALKDFVTPPSYSSSAIFMTIDVVATPCEVRWEYYQSDSVLQTSYSGLSYEERLYYYTLGTTKEEVISLKSLKFSTTCTNAEIEVFAISGAGNAIPGFFKFQTNSNDVYEITIMPSAVSQQIPYYINITGQINDLKKTKDSSFQIKIFVLPKPNTYAPVFKSVLNPLNVRVGDRIIYKLPLSLDQDGDSYHINIDSGNATGFIQTNLMSGILQIKPTSDDQIGNYTLQITLVDEASLSLSSVYNVPLQVSLRSFNLDIGKGSKGSNQQSEMQLANIKNAKAFEELRLKVQSVSNRGQIVVVLNKEWPLKQNATSVVRRDRILLEGNGQDEQIFQNITIAALLMNYEQTDESIALKIPYQVQEYSSSKMSLQLLFPDQSQISSSYSKPDEIVIRFFYNPQNKIFDSRNKAEFSQLTYRTARATIPAQISEDQAALISGMSTTTTQALWGTMATNFVIQFFLSQVLSLLWLAMNNLQLIVLLPLFRVQFPPNAEQFLNLLAMVANFDIFPTEEIFDAIFANEQSSGNSTLLTINFEEAGYQSSNVIKNIKSFFIYSIILAFLTVIYQITKRVQHKFWSAKYATEKLSKLLVYAAVIRIIIEGYLSISLATFIGLASIKHEDSSAWSIFNIFLSISLLLLITIAPFVLYYIVRRNSEKLKDSYFAGKYSTLYESLAFEKRHALAYILVLFSKRFIMAFVIVALREDFVSQILVVMISSLLALAYYIRVKPFKSIYLNHIEIFNESCFLICVYMSFLCTDVVPDAKQRYMIGWAFFGVVIGNLAVNFAGIIYTVVIYLMKVVKKLRYLVNSYEQSLKTQQVVKINPELNSSVNVIDFEEESNKSIPIENNNGNQQIAIVMNLNKIETNDESEDLSPLSRNEIGFIEQPVVRILPETEELEQPNKEAQKPKTKRIQQQNAKKKLNRRAKISINEVFFIGGNSKLGNKHQKSRDKITSQHDIQDIIGLVDEFLKKEKLTQNSGLSELNLQDDLTPQTQQSKTSQEEEHKIEENTPPSLAIRPIKYKLNSLTIDHDLKLDSFVDEALHLNSSHNLALMSEQSLNSCMIKSECRHNHTINQSIHLDKDEFSFREGRKIHESANDQNETQALPNETEIFYSIEQFDSDEVKNALNDERSQIILVRPQQTEEEGKKNKSAATTMVHQSRQGTHPQTSYMTSPKGFKGLRGNLAANPYLAAIQSSIIQESPYKSKSKHQVRERSNTQS